MPEQIYFVDGSIQETPGQIKNDLCNVIKIQSLKFNDDLISKCSITSTHSLTTLDVSNTLNKSA
jgi:hypothetical protein